MGETAGASGPDFASGVPLAELPDGGTLSGRVGDEPVLLSRMDGGMFAVSGTCTHYGGHLGDGLVTGRTVRCPLHHACFDLRTGEARRAPAFAPLDRWRVEVEEDVVFVREKMPERAASPVEPSPDGGAVVIVGGGAAAFACAEMLRRLGHRGNLTMVSADPDPPCDRPNLSKDYLAGSAPEEWIPLRDEAHYRDAGIDLRLGTEIVAIDTAGRTVTSGTGEILAFERLLLATGAEPVRLPAPSFERDNVHVLRSLADARGLIARAEKGARAAIIGSSFIGMEAAAALRERGVEVAIVSADAVPFERVLGPEIGCFFQDLHEAHGVRFHLERTAQGYDGRSLWLDDGATIDADFVLLGIGVRPRTALAAAAGIAVGEGILVDERFETSAPGIFAAGDIAEFPSSPDGRARIEHWVVAERQGQAAAAAMLGKPAGTVGAPFFWTEQYGTVLRYVGHAPGWDEVRIEGDLDGGVFTARYFEKGQFRAAASVGMDRANLEDELTLEQLAGEAANSGGK